MDRNQPNSNGWIGNPQGLYVKGKSVDFDLYIYRDAYSPIMARPCKNQYGTLRLENGVAPTLKIFNLLGQEVFTLFEGFRKNNFDGKILAAINKEIMAS